MLALHPVNEPPLHAYTLSLLILRATRFVTALAMGFVAWVKSAHSLIIPAGDSARMVGSLYAYVVGLIAACIAWAVLGAIDGVVAGIVDAVVVCYGSEVAQGGAGRYVRDIGGLFDENVGGGDVEQGDNARAGAGTSVKWRDWMPKMASTVGKAGQTGSTRAMAREEEGRGLVAASSDDF